MDNNQNNKNQSPLESLQEKLYQPGAELKERPEAPKEFQPKEFPPERIATQWGGENPEEFMTVGRYKKRKKFLNLALVAIFFAIIASGVIGYFYFFRVFQKSDVVLKIKGPESVESGENIQYFVSYQNRSNLDLENAVLILEWPKGSVLQNGSVLKVEKNIGTIGSGRESTISFPGQFFGAKNNKFTVSASLKYTPKGKTRAYEEKKSFESIVSKTPFSITMNLPPRAVSGNEVELFLEYQNLSETVFDSMRLKMEYPEGFIFSGAEPAPSLSDSVWDFSQIKGKEIGKIKIKGVLSGREKESKIFSASIGRLNEKQDLISYYNNQISIQMSSTILFVYQTVNDSRDLSISPGEYLQYKITYRNTSDLAIPNAVISAKLDSKDIDYGALNIKWGSFSGATSSIIWNASGVPQLALLGPGEEGEVSFSAKIKESISAVGSSDRNLVVASIVKIESSQIPESLKGIPIGNEDRVDVKINTAVGLFAKGFYKNLSVAIENTGPMPPRVGQKTSYTIVWQLTNTTNDINNAKVEAVLPSYVAWEGKIIPTGSDISYEKSTGRVVWDIGRIPSGTGFIMPVMQAAFQISITPGLFDVGSSPELISTSKFLGTDSFTGTELEVEAKERTINLLEDSYVMDRRGWEVAQ